MRNAAGTIERCAQSLAAQNYPKDDYEVILIDNASTDNSTDLARQFPVTIISQPIKGQYRSINTGIAQAKGEFIALTDADCVAAPDWLEKLARGFDSPSTIGVGGPIVSASAETLVEQYTDFRALLNQEKMLRDLPCSPPFLITANAMFRRETVEALGGFDPDIVPGDADFSWRAQWAGGKLKYAPDAQVKHFHRVSIGGLWEQVMRYGEGNAILFAKHRGRFGRRVWIDPQPYIWAAKAAVKTPFSWVLCATPFERRLAALDAVANIGLIAGKWRGSLRHRVLAL
jgi:cellulose synthase/poly-beta-1,6-N-acetylglucosamine synthase-like glycosyltransferase